MAFDFPLRMLSICINSVYIRVLLVPIGHLGLGYGKKKHALILRDNFMHRYCFMLQLSFTPKLDRSVTLVCALSRSLLFDVTIDL